MPIYRIATMSILITILIVISGQKGKDITTTQSRDANRTYQEFGLAFIRTCEGVATASFSPQEGGFIYNCSDPVSKSVTMGK